MGRIIYPSIKYRIRTDDSFRIKEQPEHHSCVSPFLHLKSMNMVKDFFIDIMHLLFLGVTKRFINDYWTNPGNAAKLSKINLEKLSERLKYLSNRIPCEFQRTVRNLNDLTHWKATEYRMFLLYYGPLLL